MLRVSRMLALRVHLDLGCGLKSVCLSVREFRAWAFAAKGFGVCRALNLFGAFLATK